MRTTLEIDDDVFAFARAQAQLESVTIGQIVSRLVRDGIRAQNTSRLQLAAPKSRFALLPARDEVITTQHVCDLMGEEGM